MVRVKAPKEYISEPDILKKAGEYIKNYGKKALIVASEKSLEVTKDVLLPSLEVAGIAYEIHLFTGYPTMEAAESIAASYLDSDVVIGLGGGRVIDTAKVVGTKKDVPVVTIPTIAATCASWAAVSILYNDEGEFVDAFFNKVGPILILADTKILFQAPKRYLFAGVIDTYAKWYEIAPYEKIEGDSTFLQVMIDIARRAHDTLTQKTPIALEKAKQGDIGEEAIQTIDAIIFLAGLTGSLQTDTLYQGIAHPLYNVLSYVPETKHLLHGEKVGYGLLIQQVLEKKSKEEVQEVIELFGSFDNQLTLEDLHIKNNNEILDFIAKKIWEDYHKSLNHLGYGFSADEIKESFFSTDALIEESKRKKIS
jgi:glycerol dehydrogenase-like iron-containing ADH family enzyme